MKQFLVFILAFVYLVSSAGATVHLHYCNGKLVDIRMGDDDKKPCRGCVAKKQTTKKPCMKSCCKDEHRMVKLEKDHQQTSEAQFKFLQPAAQAIPHSFFELPSVYIVSQLAQIPFSHAPPLKPPVELHLLYCNFRI